MFNHFFSLNLDMPVKVGKDFVQYLAVKKAVLGSEVLLVNADGATARMLVCEVPDTLREIVNAIEEGNE